MQTVALRCRVSASDDMSRRVIDVGGRPMAFFSELVANASAHGASIVLYSGNVRG